MTHDDPRGTPVDVTRSCYEAWMAVSDHPQPIRIRWYAIPRPAAGSYPLTEFSSSDWDDGPRDRDPTLGEQSSRRSPRSDWRDCSGPPWQVSLRFIGWDENPRVGYRDVDVGGAPVPMIMAQPHELRWFLQHGTYLQIRLPGPEILHSPITWDMTKADGVYTVLVRHGANFGDLITMVWQGRRKGNETELSLKSVEPDTFSPPESATITVVDP